MHHGFLWLSSFLSLDVAGCNLSPVSTRYVTVEALAMYMEEAAAQSLLETVLCAAPHCKNLILSVP